MIAISRELEAVKSMPNLEISGSKSTQDISSLSSLSLSHSRAGYPIPIADSQALQVLQTHQATLDFVHNRAWFLSQNGKDDELALVTASPLQIDENSASNVTNDTFETKHGQLARKAHTSTEKYLLLHAVRAVSEASQMNADETRTVNTKDTTVSLRIAEEHEKTQSERDKLSDEHPTISIFGSDAPLFHPSLLELTGLHDANKQR